MDAILQTTHSCSFSWIKNFWISNQISLKWVHYGLNKPWFQIMAWTGGKPLSESNCNLLMHICLTRPHWVNSSPPGYMRQWIGSALVRVMACHLFGAKPLPEPMLVYCQLDSWQQISMKFMPEFYHFHWRKCIWNCRLPWRPFCPGGDELKDSNLHFYFYSSKILYWYKGNCRTHQINTIPIYSDSSYAEKQVSWYAWNKL